MLMAPSCLNCAGGVGKSQQSQRRGSAHSVGRSPERWSKHGNSRPWLRAASRTSGCAAPIPACRPGQPMGHGFEKLAPLATGRHHHLTPDNHLAQGDTALEGDDA